MTLLKLLTFPLWLPVKVLWFLAKLFAFIVIVVIIGLLIIYFM